MDSDPLSTSPILQPEESESIQQATVSAISENRDDNPAEVRELLKKLDSSDAPSDLKHSVSESLDRLGRLLKANLHQGEYEQMVKYVDWIASLPWNKRSKDQLDLNTARQILDRNHYGLVSIKERILEYIAVLKLQEGRDPSGKLNLSRTPVLYFVGLPGTGKTSFAASIAEAMGRKFQRIPLGGMNSLQLLRGQPKAYPEADPSLIVKALRRAGTKNPVILLDEIDSIAQGENSDLMGVLLELLDPEQNNAFSDYYLDYPLDLSEVLFVCTGNKLGNITAAVMDRMEIVLMPRYTDEDKVNIARYYILPREIQRIGFDPNLVRFSDDVWPLLIKPYGYEIDLRSLQRTIAGILRKVAKLYVEGRIRSVIITRENYRQLLPEYV
jgi:ATP-dependent Lon protease